MMFKVYFEAPYGQEPLDKLQECPTKDSAMLFYHTYVRMAIEDERDWTVLLDKDDENILVVEVQHYEPDDEDDEEEEDL